MPLRSPRRRIAPKTKRRCRAIKEFFKKTLGTLSLTDYRTNSSVIVSVSDLKSKIDLIEKQLDKVSKHCHDISSLEHSFRKRECSTNHCEKQATPSKLTCDNRPRDKETKIIYEKPRQNYIKSNECQSIRTWDINKTSMNDIRYSSRTCNNENNEKPNKVFKQNGHRLKHLQHGYYLKERSENKKYQDNLKRVYSSISLKSPREKYNQDEACCSIYPHNYRSQNNGIETVILKDYKNSEQLKQKSKRDTEHQKKRKKSHRYSKVDEDFIADIIRKQYIPVKLFGRRFSDFSQFSAPVCRDQEFTRRDHEKESELCSCCFEGHRKIRQRKCGQYNLSDMRSVCDARLYSSKMQPRHKQVRRNNYNDSTLYDLVPVKEKSSPKTRRKFIEDNNALHERYREVLPSPRTNKPCFNLKTQRYAYDDCLLPDRCHRLIRNQEISEDHSDLTQELHNESKTIKTQHGATMSSLQNSTIGQELNINNETLNTQVTVSSADKTDKALCEIKDILQSFLQEIKKESIHSHSEISNKNIKQSQIQVHDKCYCSTTPKNNPSNLIENLAQCPAASFPAFNPCCYPVLPICPINYTPNSYLVPSPSYNCETCAQNSKETAHFANKTTKTNESCRDETQELIKEIYKCVTQNTSHAKRYSYEGASQLNIEKKILTSRSVGSSKASKHDAMVETPKLKFYSKSCEAIGSRMTSDTCYSTNPTSSDTAIEKLNLEMSRSSCESDIDRKYKDKKQKFSGVLQRLGLFKRKNKDVIEEVSESESTVEIDVKPNSRTPFKQHILNYNVHGQDFIHQTPGGRCCRAYSSPHRHVCADDFDLRGSPYDICNRPGQHLQDHSTPQYCPASHIAPCCSHDHDSLIYHNTPQIPPVPLCLKEIEVKSIGTQSDRKLSIFPRFKKNLQSPRMLIQQQKGITTQTPKDRNILLNWEKLKEKATKNISSTSDPAKFSMKTQKQLALGDTKMRNAMLKKLFYKRNPFSPRNLIIRTLLGKDRSSWGDPPRMYKPRMFL